MPKFTTISSLAQDTIKKITSNEDNWKQYLKSAGRLYKYRFLDQLLIYAQRPDATACASIDFWNTRMNCWVNRGAKGIALMDESSEAQRIKYVFDVGDVHKAKKIGKLPRLWELQENHKDFVLNRLEEIYGESDASLTFEERVQDIAHHITQESYKELSKEIQYHKDNSLLEELDELNIQVRIRDLLTSSISYLILHRCNVDPDNIEIDFDFSSISEFNTVETLSQLGNAVSNLTKPFLIEIGKAIEAYERDLDQEDLAKTSNVEYNALKYKSGEVTYGINEATERGNYNDTIDISEERRLFHTRDYIGRATGGDIDEIRIDEKEIPEGVQGGNLQRSSSFQQAEGAFTTDSAAGRREIGSSYGADEKERGNNGGTEGRESNALGSEDEQHSTFSGGNRTDRTNIQLSLFPSVEEQLRSIAVDHADDKFAIPAAFFISDSMVDQVQPSTDQVTNVIVDKANSNMDAKVVKEPPKQVLHNFQIKDEQLGHGGAKEKFQRNVEAIETLKQIESENRIATLHEQNILSKYVGWGGLSQAFDESNTAWSKEYLQLKELLSEGEFSSARESTLNAHYTSPIIIDAMYAALEQTGFEDGKILEPSMGTGNFFGMLPNKMQASSLYGVELDDLTGRIAKQLYSNAKIEILGYEDVQYPDNYFDLVIGNIPFGQYKVSDKAYDKYNFLIHDYFFAKSLDKVRDGGVVAFITSSGTMDKQNSSVRRYLSQKAELLGAIRLPDTAFKANAGTKVMADILFFKKEERKDELEPPWVQLSQTDDGFTMNQYFVQHPEMILGKMTMESGPFGEVVTCKAIKEVDFKEQSSNYNYQRFTHLYGKKKEMKKPLKKQIKRLVNRL